MAVLEIVQGCRVEWREGGHAPTPGIRRSGSNGLLRSLQSVEVRRTGRDTFEFTRPKSRSIVVKRISGRNVSVVGPGDEDILARWRRE